MPYYIVSTHLQTKQRIQTTTLPCLNYNFTIIFQPQRYRLASPRKLAAPNSQYISAANNEYDFGGIELRFPEYHTSQYYGRIIYHDSYDDIGYEELWNAADDDGSMESYYAFDDDDKRSPLVMYDDPDIHLRKKCRRTNWHRQLPITCNSIHELDFQGHAVIGDTKYLGYVTL